MDYYIYILRNEINGCLYVGQTNNLYRRMIQHKYMSKHSRLKFHYSIKKYGWENFKVIREFTCPEYLVDGFEQSLIKSLREDFGEHNIYNISDGGQGNRECAIETRLKIAEKLKGNKNSVGTKRIGYKGFQGIHSEESKKKISQAKSNIGVIVFYKNGNLLKEFNTVREASQELHLDRGRVYDCLNHKRKTHKNYIYRKVG